MKTFIKLTVIIIFSTVWSACHKCIEDPSPCQGDIACTEQFVSVTVPFEFDSVNLNSLDYSETFLEDTGEKIFVKKYNQPFEIGPFHAVILSDSQMAKINKNGSNLRFELFNKSGGLIYTATFVIGHDCCHIEKLSGPDKIKL